MFIPAYAQSMVRLLEDSLNTNLLTIELSEFIAKVKQIFIEDLRIININYRVPDKDRLETNRHVTIKSNFRRTT